MSAANNPIKCRARIGVIIEMTMKYAGAARPTKAQTKPTEPAKSSLMRGKFAQTRNLHRYQNATLKLIAFIVEVTANKPKQRRLARIAAYPVQQQLKTQQIQHSLERPCQKDIKVSCYYFQHDPHNTQCGISLSCEYVPTQICHSLF